MSDLGFEGLEVGYDIPALPGMDVGQVETPCLILDLDALERNITKMGAFAQTMGVAHRAHGKMHRSVDVAALQMRLGGACGVCCQKVSEAEAFVRGGITDVLISNQITQLSKIDRMARLPQMGARICVCVDDLRNVADLSAAAQRHGTHMGCLVEMEVGAERCGVITSQDAVEIARAITDAPGLTFEGIQAYQGAMQHVVHHRDRQAEAARVIAKVSDVLQAMTGAGLKVETVTGAGTGSFQFEGASGIYTELQCGSYAFMDADYGRVLDGAGDRLDQGTWENALFVLTSVMSHVKADRAVVDAGLKALSVDSGLPVVFGRDDLECLNCSDEHAVIRDPGAVLGINEQVKLVPGHCDPTCNLHDWYVGVRGNKVEVVWPVSARGKSY